MAQLVDNVWWDLIATPECVSEPTELFSQLKTIVTSQSASSSSLEYPTLDALIALETPLISLAVLEAGNITTQVLGRRPSNNETLFQAASLSKSFTALAVIKLCQEGKLNLEAPISKYLTSEMLSWVSTPKTGGLVSEITLFQLLSHTSGLSINGFEGYLPTQEIPTLEQILKCKAPAHSERIKLLRFPGQKYSYSGGGYTIIQLILEVVLQKPFAEIMHQVVLSPLDVQRSTFNFLAPTDPNYAPVFLNGKNKADPEYSLYPDKAAAGLWTTPSDLLKVVRAVQESLKSDDGFLEKKWARKMLEEVDGNGTALGWRTKEKGNMFGHSGWNPPGYNSWVFGYADLDFDGTTPQKKAESIPKDCGISVMINSALGQEVQNKILAAITYLKNWPSAVPRPIIPFVDYGAALDPKARRWGGDWQPGNWHLVEVKDKLLLRFGASISIPLLVAAVPPHKYDEGTSIDLMPEGLEMMLRLGWDNGVQIVEVWESGSVTTLRRSFGLSV